MTRDTVLCAGGCERVVRPGDRFCDKCRPLDARASDGAQPDLFSSPTPAKQRTRAALPDRVALTNPPHQSSSPTSTAAATAVSPLFPAQLQRVLAAVIHARDGGLTRAELAAVLKMRLSSVCSAVRTLYRQGLIGSNEGVTRVDPETHMNVEVLVSERYVKRWQDASGALIPRRTRTLLDGALCDLVSAYSDNPITEAQKRQQQKELDAARQKHDAQELEGCTNDDEVAAITRQQTQ